MFVLVFCFAKWQKIYTKRVYHLFANKWHNADACEDVLSGQSFPGDAICKRLSAVGSGLTEMTHKERDVGPGRERGRERVNEEYMKKEEKMHT